MEITKWKKLKKKKLEMQNFNPRKTKRNTIRKQNNQKKCHKHINIFLKIRNVQSQKNRQNSQPKALSKLLVFS